MRSSEYTNSKGYLHRYFVRWITEERKGMLSAIGWEVCDRRKFDNIGLCKFEGKTEADGMCKLLNSIEEENDGVSK
jgi:hypothetical protein